MLGVYSSPHATGPRESCKTPESGILTQVGLIDQLGESLSQQVGLKKLRECSVLGRYDAARCCDIAVGLKKLGGDCGFP